MRKIAFALVVIGVTAGLAAWMGLFDRSEEPAGKAVEAGHVEEVDGEGGDNTREFRVGGELGEMDHPVVVGLCMSIPGVTAAELDVATSTLMLTVLPNVFQQKVLSDTLSRPGQGWTIFPNSPSK